MNEHQKFLHKLCIELDYKTVQELINTMSSNELADWIVYYKEEKFLADRLEIQLATIADLIYKSNFSGDKEFIDFMVTVSQEAKDKTKKNLKDLQVIDSLGDFQ